RFTTDYADLAHAEVHFLGLGTPQRADGFGADLSHLDAAVASLAQVLPARDGAPTLVVGKSTVPAGTARLLAERLAPVDGAYLLWNPEFLREGFAVQDTLDPDRLVYGVHEPGTPAAERAVAMLDRVYAGVLEHDPPRLVMGYEAAELVKASANAFLATKISFINAVSEMCEATGADVTDVARAIGMDERIGSKFLRAGVGFGGGCLPKDIRAFMASAEQHGVGEALGFLREVDAVNERRRARVVALADEMLGDLAGRRVTVLGAAFKPDSDDTRDSPALDVACRLRAAGALVTVTDPEALDNARRRLGDLVEFVPDTDEALRGTELTVLLTEWDEYRELDPARTASLPAAPRMIDGRNVLSPQAWREAGWEIRSLGRASVPSGPPPAAPGPAAAPAPPRPLPPGTDSSPSEPGRGVPGPPRGHAIATSGRARWRAATAPARPSAIPSTSQPSSQVRSPDGSIQPPPIAPRNASTAWVIGRYGCTTWKKRGRVGVG